MKIGELVENFLADVRLSTRSLLKNRGFLVVVILSLALGIAANSTIFSVLNALLYRPLPYPDPGRLVVIWQAEHSKPNVRQAPPIAETVDWKKQNHVFEDICLSSGNDAIVVTGLGEPRPLRTQYVTPNFFSMLGVKPVLGRVFQGEEAQDRVQSIVISTPFWQRQYHSDPQVLGKSVTIEGIVSTIVGVIPAGFSPFFGRPIDLWQPINPENTRYSGRIDHWLMPVARLKPGTTMEQAQQEMDVIARRLEEQYPATNKGVGEKVVLLHEELFGWARTALYPLLGAVGFVLLIACLNVANLFQFRTETRRKEYALRVSLGAGRKRLVQQLLTESALLAFTGGALGILLTVAGIKLFLALAGGEFPNASAISLDARVLMFTLVMSLVTAILFGIGPALHASRPDLNLVLREGERKMTTSGSRLARHGLAVAEVALALVLLVGAGLMINTILRLQRVKPGFDANHVVAMDFQVPEGGKYLERIPGGDMEKVLPTVAAFYQRLLEKTSALPGVESAALIGAIPTRCCAEQYSFSVVGHAMPAPENRPQAGYSETSAGLFDTLKIPLLKGRYLNERDTLSAPWVIVVNETFARRYFPNEEPIGQQILMRYDPYPVDQPRPRQIVGVVGDVKHFGLGGETFPFVYAPYLQQGTILPGGAARAHLHQGLLLRARPELLTGGASLVSMVKNAVAEIDADQPVTNIMTMDHLLAESIGDWRFFMRILGLFAGLAVMLAVVGIYGVMSYSVNERTHEIGVRMALGAQRGDVLGLVTKLGLQLTGVGVAIGIVMALGLTRLMSAILYGVKPSDPITYAAVAFGLGCVAMLACFIPARRAAKVDPMVALRYE
jgi:putative ABC transport system permease protein